MATGKAMGTLMDLGVFTVVPQQYTMVVSQHATGGEQARSRMLTYHGAGLIHPQSAAYLPRAEFLAWHKEQVFKTPAQRTLTGSGIWIALPTSRSPDFTDSVALPTSRATACGPDRE